MIFTETKIAGAFIIETERIEDSRGFFARAWCEKEFETYGLSSHFLQCNISFSCKKGTLRGLHYQVPPYQEVKVIRCTKGAIYDVIIDLRPESATYRQWLGVELSADNYKMLYVPKDIANGFQTLEEETEVFYPVSQFYYLEAERGIRWDDPLFAIEWPIDVKEISDKDKKWPDYLP